MANCPQCASSPLVHSMLNEDLAGYSCAKCFGTLVSLVAYRAWREKHARPAAATAAAPDVETPDSLAAKKCPKCSSLMSKYRIASVPSNRLDYCPHCEEIWLDGGEWELVESLVQSGELTRVFTQGWQRAVRAEIAESMSEQRFQELLGPDYARVTEFAAWLSDHKSRNEILARLQRRKR